MAPDAIVSTPRIIPCAGSGFRVENFVHMVTESLTGSHRQCTHEQGQTIGYIGEKPFARSPLTECRDLGICEDRNGPMSNVSKVRTFGRHPERNTEDSGPTRGPPHSKTPTAAKPTAEGTGSDQDTRYVNDKAYREAPIS